MTDMELFKANVSEAVNQGIVSKLDALQLLDMRRRMEEKLRELGEKQGEKQVEVKVEVEGGEG